MKKVIFVLSFIVPFFCFGQFPNNPTPQGNDKTNTIFKGGVTAQLGFGNVSFPDTATANLNSYIKGIPYWQIIINDTIYIRDKFAKKWVKQAGGGSSGIDTAVVNELISDSIFANIQYIKNATSGVGQLLYKQADTVKSKTIVAGNGVILDSTGTTIIPKADTTAGDTHLVSQYMLNRKVADTAAALRAIIGTGGTQTPWASDIDAAHYYLFNLGKLTVNNLTGGGATTYGAFDPANKYSIWTLSGGDLTATASSGDYGIAKATIGQSTGSWYVEFHVTTGGSGKIGIAKSTTVLHGALGNDPDSYAYQEDGQMKNNGATYSSGATFTAGDYIGMNYDAGAGTLSFYKNGALQGTPATGVTGNYYPAISAFFSSFTVTANFGASSFTHAAPGGSNPGWYTGGGTDTTHILRTTDSGRVVIGDSFPSSAKLIVSGGIQSDTLVKAPFLYAGNMTTTYGSYHGLIVGSTNRRGLVDWVDNGSRVAEIYTTDSSANFWSETGKHLQFFVNNNFAVPVITAHSNGNIGISDPSPTAKLSILGSIKINVGTPAAGKVLTATDSDGNATWQTISGFTQVVATDANITAVDRTLYHLPAATLSTGRTINVSGLTDGQSIKILNNEAGFTWSFTGASVYLVDGTTTITNLSVNTFYELIKINGKIIKVH